MAKPTKKEMKELQAEEGAEEMIEGVAETAAGAAEMGAAG